MMDLDPTSLFARVPDALQNLTWSMLRPERDCAATGAFIAQIGHFNLESNGDQNNYPLHELSAFIQGCPNVTLADVSYGGLADWFIYNSAVDSTGLTSLVEEVGNGTCVLDYCKSYNFEGDPDLAGIGVSAAFSVIVMMMVDIRNVVEQREAIIDTGCMQHNLLQTVVTTCFILAYFYKTWSAWRRNRTGEAKGRGILGSDLTTPTSIKLTMSITPSSERLQDSLSVFWISSLYFSVAVTIAAIVYDYRDKSPGTQYGYLFSNTGAHFTLMVLICLWPWYSQQSRSYSKAMLLAVVVVLFPFLFFATYFTQFWPTLSGFEQACPFVSPELFRLYSVKCYFDIFVMTFVPTYRCVFLASFRSGPEKENTIFGYFKRHRARIANATLFVFYLFSFAILWIDLVVFGLSRQRAHEQAGHSDSEDVWSFGQVVSVTGWLPVIIGLFRVWSCRFFCRSFPAGLL